MIVRHIVEISEDDVMTYHFYYLSRATTLNSANTKLVTLAPVLRPERRFAPLARGLYIIHNRRYYFYLSREAHGYYAEANYDNIRI